MQCQLSVTERVQFLFPLFAIGRREFHKGCNQPSGEQTRQCNKLIGITEPNKTLFFMNRFVETSHRCSQLLFTLPGAHENDN